MHSIAQQKEQRRILSMKRRSLVEMLAVVVCTAVLIPVVSKASHPPVIPAVAHAARTTQSLVDPPGNGQYQFTTIDVPNTSDTEAFGINNTGLVSGFYTVNGTGHGFLWRDGTVTTVDQGSGSNTLL